MFQLLILLVLLIAHLTLAAPQATTETSSTEYTSDTAFRDAVLNATNTFRAQHNASDLVWNETLAEFAVDWSEECGFEHSVSQSVQMYEY